MAETRGPLAESIEELLAGITGSPPPRRAAKRNAPPNIPSPDCWHLWSAAQQWALFRNLREYNDMRNQENRKQSAADVQRRNRIEDAWIDCRAPRLHKELALRSPVWPRPELAAQVVGCLSQGGSPMLLGPRGTGKTQLAVCLMREHILASARTALYTRADEMFATLRRGFARESQDSGEFERRLCQCGLLVIDEIQDRGDSDFEDRTLRLIFDKRYGAKLPTILIGNLAMKEIHNRLGNSIVSRINEIGTIFVIDWPSFRTPRSGAA